MKFEGIGSFEKRIGINKSIPELKEQRKAERKERMAKHREAFVETSKKVEKPFNVVSKGLDFGKPKKIKKSYSSGGLKF